VPSLQRVGPAWHYNSNKTVKKIKTQQSRASFTIPII